MNAATVILLFLNIGISIAKETTVASSSITSYDIAIIGGGPAGLASAIAINRAFQGTKEENNNTPHIPAPSIAIFERSSSLREVGGQVALFGPAMNALDAIDSTKTLSQKVKDNGIRRKVFRMLDMEDKVVTEKDLAEDDNQFAIAWFQLQRVLKEFLLENHGNVKGSESNSGSDLCSSRSVEFHLGHELKELEEDSEKGEVLLTFQNGVRCRAKLVIGADGNLSRVRSELFHDEEFPEYAGSCIWRMFLKGNYEGIALGELNVWTGDGKVLTVQKMGMGDDARLYVSGQAGWPDEKLDLLDRKRYIGSEDGKDSGGTSRSDDRLGRFLDMFRDAPAQIADFCRNNHGSASILEHPIYFRPVGREWGKGRVTLVGDAAHMIPPNMGMGTPLAFEDAVSLGQSIQRNGLSTEALRAYEKERQPRVNKIAYKAISDSGSYYKRKDDEANPFKLNDKEMFAFVMNFRQEPIA